MSKSHGSEDVLKTLAHRRTYYALKSTSKISDARIEEIISQIMLTVPSSFNMQTIRLVVALHDHHKKVWDIAAAGLKADIGEERFNSGTKDRMDGFRNAYGTVLFYTEPQTIKQMEEKMPTYREQFGPWAEHTQGMHQLAIWVALEADGLGANLQHYNPYLQSEAAKVFDIPENWTLKAQLVFGDIVGNRPDPKDKKPLSETIKFLGSQ